MEDDGDDGWGLFTRQRVPEKQKTEVHAVQEKRHSISLTTKEKKKPNQQQHQQRRPQNSKRKPAVPTETTRDEDDEDEDVDGGISASTIGDDIISMIDEEALDALSTFDKGHRSRAGKDDRLETIRSRIKRSEEKMNDEQKSIIHGGGGGGATSSPNLLFLDDSLLTDHVQRTARSYEKHVHMRNNSRFHTAEEEEDSGSPRPMECNSDNDCNDDGGRCDDNFYLEEEEEKEEEDDEGLPTINFSDHVAKTVIAPGSKYPETGDRPTINTFSEFISNNNPRMANFDKNMNVVKGQEQVTFVGVRKDEEIYRDVNDALDPSSSRRQFFEYTVRKGMKIPDLPEVTKAEIRDGLYGPDLEIGERPCVRDQQCTSYIESLKRKKQFPERYHYVEPFCCKEFYYGDKGAEISEAIARGTPLVEVQPRNRVFCVMCHFSIVKAKYTENDLGLNKFPIHVLHSFRMIANIPGQYPKVKMLMGDSKYNGIIAEFLRYCPDDYEWVPVNPTKFRTEVDHMTGMMKKLAIMPVQHWDEGESLDFQ